MHKFTLAIALAALLAPLGDAGGRTSSRSYGGTSRSSSTRPRTSTGSHSTSRSASVARPKATSRTPRSAKITPPRAAAAPKARPSRTPSTKCLTCERDRHGRIKRSEGAKRRFQQSNPCPLTGKTSGGCPGYQIDHKVPLSKEGADTPSNMQWLTDEQHKAKHTAK